MRCGILIEIGAGKYLVDRHNLPRLRTGEEFVVVITPPSRDAGAEHAALKLWIAAWPRHDVEDTHLEDVAGLRILDRDRACANVHPEPLARATPEHRCIHRPCAAPIDVLPLTGPAEDAFGTGIA